jgi:hypothetical protein
MINLRDELANLAGQAHPYGDARAAVTTARRRTARRALAIPTVAVVVVLAVVFAWLHPRPSALGPTNPTPPIPTVSTPPTTRPTPDPNVTPTGDYPVVRVAPDPNAPSLPVDRAVGPASFATLPFGGLVRFVLADGTQYRLDPPADVAADRGLGLALSPDGRYVVWNLRSGVNVRDLAGTTAVQVPTSGLVAGWSASGRWILLRADGDHWETMEMQTWRRTAVAGTRPPLGVLDDGTVLVRDTSVQATPARLAVAVIDPASGATRRRFVVDASSVLAPGESILTLYSGDGGGAPFPMFHLVVGQDFGVLQLNYSHGDIGYEGLGGLVAFSLRDGSVHRVDPPGFVREQTTWHLNSAAGSEFVLGHDLGATTYIAMLDPEGGAVRTVCALAPTPYILRGSPGSV